MEPAKSKAKSAVKRLDEIKEDAKITKITVNPVNRHTDTTMMSNNSFKIYPDGIDYTNQKEIFDESFYGRLYLEPSNVLFEYEAKYSKDKE